MGAVGQQESTGEAEQYWRQSGIGVDADDRHDGQRSKGEGHRRDGDERRQDAPHLHGHSDEAPDRPEQEPAHQVADKQSEVEGEPVVRPGVLWCEGDGEAGRTDLEANRREVVQRLERRLSGGDGDDADRDDSRGDMDERCDQLHAERQRQLHQRHAV